MIADILGTEYDLQIIKKQDKVMKAKNLSGYTDYTSKKIRVLRFKKESEYDCENLDVLTAQVLRHELLHAFMYESGMDVGTLFHNEETVDWIAMQLPKIVDVCYKIMDDLENNVMK